MVSDHGFHGQKGILPPTMVNNKGANKGLIRGKYGTNKVIIIG